MLVMSDVTGLGQDAEVIRYIIEQIVTNRQTGMTDAEITKMLIGWGEESVAIQQAFAQLTAQQAAAAAASNAQQNGKPPKKPTPKWVLPVAIGGGVLLLGGLAVVAMRK